MAPPPPATANGSPAPPRSVGYHGAVHDFKRQLIEATLHQVRGNRTHAAKALGLQRTYLLRLMRDLGVVAPPPAPTRRRTHLAGSAGH
jgi:DNA-binding NtrC family response regulator